MPILQQDLRTGRGQIEFELDHAEYAAIGRVMVQWAYLEQGIYEMSVAIAEAFEVELPNDARQASFRKRAGALRGLIRTHLGDVEKGRFEKLLDRVARMADQRNRVAHGTWEWDPDDPELLNASCLLTTGLFESNYSNDKINEIADEIGRISFEFQYPEGWKGALIDVLANGNPEAQNVAYCSILRNHVRLKKQKEI